jgi:hypothetical protein
MQELISKLRSDDLVIAFLFILCFVAGLIVWLSLQWRLHRRTEMEIALKQDMLNRGMSAEDIERVLQALTISGGGRREEAAASDRQERHVLGC